MLHQKDADASAYEFHIDMMEHEYSSISISMPKVKESHVQKNSYIYEIDVATRWGRWHVEKKYDQFRELHKILQAQFNELPDFPDGLIALGIAFFLGESPEQLEHNRAQLEQYMQESSKRKDIINTSAYTEFLQLDKHSPQMLANKPVLLDEFEMEERVNDEGKVILDYYYDDSFIVFATGNDSHLERFNSLVANSKFPWEEEEQVEFVLPLGTVECWLKRKDTGKYRRVWARNYPIETRKLIFNPQSKVMAVGLADGGVEVFQLLNKQRYIYYEVIKLLQAHEDEVCGLHLDEPNLMIYSASCDGWINVIDAKRAVLLDSLETSSPIIAMQGDRKNMRLFVSLGQGNIEIYEYNPNSKLICRHVLCPPESGELRTLLFDPVRNYFFAAAYETGEVFIFEIGKQGHEKVSKQIGYLRNKEHIVDMLWQSQKMELLLSTLDGEIFFWDTVKAKQIYMLKAFEDRQLSKSMYLSDKRMIITASRGRAVKFWEIPKSWRDCLADQEEEREIEIRRKVENLYKIREALKRKEADSSDDDLKGWHWSEDSEDSKGT